MVRTAAVVATVAIGLSVGAVGLAAVPGTGAPPVRTSPPVAEAAAPPHVNQGADAADGRADAADQGAGAAGGAEGPGDGRTMTVPLDAPHVVARPFDGPAQPWAPGHRGVDLAAHVDQPVRAPQAGVVTFAGTVVDRGIVTVTHDGGLRSSLEPVTWTVTRGQRVLQGQVVGSVASTAGHCAPATCLHWGLRRGETYLDPMRWVLDRGPVVLLPEP